MTGYTLPGGGSIIIGYGRNTDGNFSIIIISVMIQKMQYLFYIFSGYLSALEGEVFGFYMLLISTIERNMSSKVDFRYINPLFSKNKMKNNEDVNYIILNDLDTSKTAMVQDFGKKRESSTTPRNYIRFTTPFSMIDHDVGFDFSVPLSEKPEKIDDEKEIFDLPISNQKINLKNQEKINFWSFVNKAGNEGKFKKQSLKLKEQIHSGTEDLPTLPLFETPPPKPESVIQSLIKRNNKQQKPIIETTSIKSDVVILSKISEIETPPPVPRTNAVYGQWSSTNFAGNVLNYLKSINYHKIYPRKIPSTIPLKKISDNFPYSSEFKVITVKPEINIKNIQRRHFKVTKRETHAPVINVKIEEEDIRQDILKSHAQTHPKNVIINNVGENNKQIGDKYYNEGNDHVSSEENVNEIGNKITPKPFSVHMSNNINRNKSHDFRKSNRLNSILPFLKTFEYFMQIIEQHNNATVEKNDDNNMYSKMLAKRNKWHNVKSYSNDYTPRRINIQNLDNFEETIVDPGQKIPSIKIKYKYDDINNRNNVHKNENYYVKKNQSYHLNEKNHDQTSDTSRLNERFRMEIEKKEHFNQQVKIGNALDELKIIGLSENDKERSFLGGDDRVPDINRYRSDIDSNSDNNVPSSLDPAVCRKSNLHSNLLYILNDGSIEGKKINSPIKSRNRAIKFISDIYKQCSTGETLQNNALLLINWSQTPVRLFGGAYPKKITDVVLCEFKAIYSGSIE